MELEKYQIGKGLGLSEDSEDEMWKKFEMLSKEEQKKIITQYHLMRDKDTMSQLVDRKESKNFQG